MRVVRFLAFFALLTSSLTCFAGDEWLPITPQDQAFKEVPGNPGAPAIRLYYAHEINDNTSSEFVYHRIKILNDKGKQYADVEIPIFVEEGLFLLIKNLKARTIRPDGSIVEFTGKPYEKIVFKGRGDKLSVKAFTMPEVCVGCIIEYKYEYFYQTPPFAIGNSTFLARLPFFSSDEWVMQDELYTVKEHLYFRPYEGGQFQSMSQVSFEWDGAKVSHVAFNLKEKPKAKGNEVELDMQNVPALEPERYMPPEDNYKPSVVFFYNRRGSSNSVDKEWEELGKDRYDRLETYLSKNRGVKEAAMEAINGENDPVGKLRKLYARAQKIRNLSYERPRTTEELKKENLQRSEGPGDTIARGYGTDQDITLLFIAMARVAGFDANAVHVSDRRRRFFAKDYTSLRQIAHMIAAVSVNGADIYLEPGTKFCPFGLQRWNHTATDALKLNKKGGVFVKTPQPDYQKSATSRAAKLALGPDGSAKGEVEVSFQGMEALEHRLEAVQKDDEGRKKDLEDELKTWLPEGSVVKLAEARAWEGTDEPLSARFTVDVPSFAAATGQRLLAPAFLFQTKQKDAFKHADRTFPVYFPYAYTEMDQVELALPAGFTVESIPQQQDARLPYARYQNAAGMSGPQVMSQRKLSLNALFIPKEKYIEVRDFFNKAEQGDDQQIILRGKRP